MPSFNFTFPSLIVSEHMRRINYQRKEARLVIWSNLLRLNKRVVKRLSSLSTIRSLSLYHIDDLTLAQFDSCTDGLSGRLVNKNEKLCSLWLVCLPTKSIESPTRSIIVLLKIPLYCLRKTKLFRGMSWLTHFIIARFSYTIKRDLQYVFRGSNLLSRYITPAFILNLRS